MPTFIGFDLETTGLLKPETDDPHLQPGIVEFGAIKFHIDKGKYEKLDQIQIILDPEVFYEEEAQKITGITPEETYGKPNFVEKFSEIANFFLGVDGMIHYNGAYYDCPVLMYNLRRYGLEHQFPWSPTHYDMGVISKDFASIPGKTGNKMPKLVELYEFLFGKPFEGAHRSIADSQATIECFVEFVNREWIKL